MPHFIIECSDELIQKHKPKEILETVYNAAKSTKLFAPGGAGGIKVRINNYQHYLTSDLQADFIHVFAHIMEGRTEEQKRTLSQNIVSELHRLFPDLEVISMNILDIDKKSYVNKAMVVS
tara:strand:+ start:546 stop:905 length:360 start_codon:yes stop_codon:yes gene_type:complete